MRGSEGEGKKQEMEEERRGGMVEMTIRETAVKSKSSVVFVQLSGVMVLWPLGGDRTNKH